MSGPDQTLYRISLYEPTTPPEAPSKVIGRAAITGDLWAQISGSWGYYNIGRRDSFRLQALPPTYTTDFAADAKVDAVSTIHRIDCNVVRLWQSGRDTYNWRVVVPDPAHRELITANKDWHWEGW